jgi:hypothetical protein
MVKINQKKRRYQCGVATASQNRRHKQRGRRGACAGIAVPRVHGVSLVAAQARASARAGKTAALWRQRYRQTSGEGKSGWAEGGNIKKTVINRNIMAASAAAALAKISAIKMWRQ